MPKKRVKTEYFPKIYLKKKTFDINTKLTENLEDKFS